MKNFIRPVFGGIVCSLILLIIQGCINSKNANADQWLPKTVDYPNVKLNGTRTIKTYDCDSDVLLYTVDSSAGKAIAPVPFSELTEKGKTDFRIYCK